MDGHESVALPGRRRGRGGGGVAEPDIPDMLREFLPDNGLLPGAPAGSGPAEFVREQYRDGAESDGMRRLDTA